MDADDPTDTASGLEDEVGALLAKVELLLASTEREIEALAAKANRLELLRSSLAGYLSAELTGEPLNRTQFSRIADFLRRASGAKTLAEIAAGTGIHQASVSAVVYRTHREQFASERTARERARRWRLASPTEGVS